MIHLVSVQQKYGKSVRDITGLRLDDDDYPLPAKSHSRRVRLRDGTKLNFNFGCVNSQYPIKNVYFLKKEDIFCWKLFLQTKCLMAKNHGSLESDKHVVHTVARA